VSAGYRSSQASRIIADLEADLFARENEAKSVTPLGTQSYGARAT